MFFDILIYSCMYKQNMAVSPLKREYSNQKIINHKQGIVFHLYTVLVSVDGVTVSSVPASLPVDAKLFSIKQ